MNMGGTTCNYYGMEREIRGYHVYGKMWRLSINDLFITNNWELSNEDDKFAVGVYQTCSADGGS